MRPNPNDSVIRWACLRRVMEDLHDRRCILRLASARVRSEHYAADLMYVPLREKSESDLVIEEVFREVQRECEKGEQFPPEAHCGVTAARGPNSLSVADLDHVPDEASTSTWTWT